MIRVGFLGSDSTHAEAFGNLINGPGGLFQGEASVVSIWGADPAEAARKAKALRITNCADTIAEALEDIDLAMVIGRFGDSHFEPARLALESGLPTFVDKPFVSTIAEAKELARIAKASGGRIVSSSPLRFSAELMSLIEDRLQPDAVVVSAPANCTDLGSDERLKSVFFYGIHAVEMLLELMGADILRVSIVPGKRAVTAHLEFPACSASVQLIRDADEFYEMNVYTRENRRQFTVKLDGGYYPHLLRFLFEEFYPGARTIPLESTLQAISLLEEIEKADLGVSNGS